MASKKTHAQYEEELFRKEIDYWPVEEYLTNKTPILHECLHGHRWPVSPSSILGGSGCPVCSNKLQKTTVMYAEELLSKELNIKVLDSYKGAKTPILHECKAGHKWKAIPNNVLSGSGCPDCNRVGKYNPTFFSRNPEIAKSPGILYLVVLVNKETNVRECLKIGITKGTNFKDVKRRANGFKGYEYRLLKIVKGSLEEVFNLEQSLHKLWANKRHFSSKKFPGHTELFDLDDEIIRSVPGHLG